MRRTTILGALAFLILAVAATSAPAITNGQPDGTRHPAVGALVGYIEAAGGTVPYCSGTLISPTVFLTSAHCGFLATPTVEVTFEEAHTASSIVYTGTFHAHPEFTPGTNAQGTQLFDIAVVVFPEPIPGITPARLPTAGLLDQMRAARTLGQSSLFTSVGYGSTEFVNRPGGQTTTYPHTRNYAIGPFNSLTSSFLHLSQHTKKGEGGTCYGDSGGPIFLGAGANEADVIAGIITTGDTYCGSTNVGYRIDTEAARDFLDDYVTLP